MKPTTEAARMEALQQYDVLDTLPQQAYDDLAYLAASICQTPMAMITFIDDRRQWCKSTFGVPSREIPRNISFCAHAIGQPDDLLLPDPPPFPLRCTESTPNICSLQEGRMGIVAGIL